MDGARLRTRQACALGSKFADDSLLVILNHIGPEDIRAGADGFDQNADYCEGEHPPCCAGLPSPIHQCLNHHHASVLRRRSGEYDGHVLTRAESISAQLRQFVIKTALFLYA